MMHDDLIDIAEKLARLEPGRPKRTSLRKAVSSAYYSLFHTLAYLCADTLIGESKPWELYTPIYRTLDHGRSKEVFSRWGLRQSGQIAEVAQIFILLQELRHTADYDPEPFRYGREETLDLIKQARTAVAIVSALSSDEKLLLSSKLISRTRKSS